MHRVAKVILLAAGILVALLVGFLLYELLRPKTTLAEVQQWMTTLPPNADTKQVEQLFDAKGMSWEIIQPGRSPGYFNFSTDPGIRGCVKDSDRGWIWQESIYVFVTFDANGHVHQIQYQEWGIGP